MKNKLDEGQTLHIGSIRELFISFLHQNTIIFLMFWCHNLTPIPPPKKKVLLPAKKKRKWKGISLNPFKKACCVCHLSYLRLMIYEVLDSNRAYLLQVYLNSLLCNKLTILLIFSRARCFQQTRRWQNCSTKFWIEAFLSKTNHFSLTAIKIIENI